MRKAALAGLCMTLLWAAGSAWAGEAADVEALKKQLAELNAKVEAVRAKRDGLRAEIRKSPDLAALREAYDKAQAAYDEKKKTDEAYAAAVKAEDEARQAFDTLVKEKLAANEDGKQAQADLDAAKGDTPEAKQARSAAREKLDEIRRTIGKSDDADVKAAREKLDAARKARDEARKGEALSAARKARDEARDAYEAKATELEKGNADLVAAVKEREDLGEQVRALEKKIKEAEPAKQ